MCICLKIKHRSGIGFTELVVGKCIGHTTNVVESVTWHLPDMFTLSPRACCPRASGVHIREATGVHVTNTKWATTQ